MSINPLSAAAYPDSAISAKEKETSSKLQKYNNSQTYTFDEIQQMIDSGVINIDRIGIALGGDVNNIVYFNRASTGDKTLTEEQAAYLREKYDMDNLSQEQYIKLLGELSDFGVIDGAFAMGEARSILNGRPFQSAEADFSKKLDDWIKYFLDRMNLNKDDAIRLRTVNHASPLMIDDAQRLSDFYEKLSDIMGSVFKAKPE